MVATGKLDALLHHLDRGSHVWDNAVIKSFFSSVKTERPAARRT